MAEMNRGFLAGLGEVVSDAIIALFTVLGLRALEGKKDDSPRTAIMRDKLSPIIAELILHKDEDERVKIMDDIGGLQSEDPTARANLFAAQEDRQNKSPRPYGQHVPYESGSEKIFVDALTAMRRAFHPNEYLPEEIVDSASKQRMKNPDRAKPEMEAMLHNRYKERLKELGHLLRHELDARIEFIHDDRRARALEWLKDFFGGINEKVGEGLTNTADILRMLRLDSTLLTEARARIEARRARTQTPQPTSAAMRFLRWMGR